MNEEQLRAALDALFAQYGGPIEPFMDVVDQWAEDQQ